MSFVLGPKPTQDTMTNVFEQKKYLGKKILGEKDFSGPPGPPTEKFFGAGPGRPGRAAGEANVVKIDPLGYLTRLKRSATRKVHEKGGVVRPVTLPLSKVMPKTCCLASIAPPPPCPRRPGRTGPGRVRKCFRSGVPGVRKKFFPPQIFLLKKRYSLGPG